jgi:hypothetical protein
MDSSVYLEKYKIQESIDKCIQSLDGYMVTILYYNNAIEVDWCEEAHNVYRKNKENYLSNAHKWYAKHMEQLILYKEQLQAANDVLKRISDASYSLRLEEKEFNF